MDTALDKRCTIRKDSIKYECSAQSPRAPKVPCASNACQWATPNEVNGCRAGHGGSYGCHRRRRCPGWT